MLRLMCACAAAAFVALLPAAQQRSSDGAIVRGSLERKDVALVFTGHEFAEAGNAILDALGPRRARVSFFLTGDFLRRAEFGDLVRRIVAGGHYLGPHSDKHLLYCDWTAAKKTLVTREQFRGDLDANLREIERFGVARERARYFLPAYEWCNRDVVAWAGDSGLETVNLTVGTRSNTDYMEDDDPKHVPSREIVESILRAERVDRHGLNGFILLMHVGAGPRRADKLAPLIPGLLDALTARGYRFVRIDELLAASEPDRRDARPTEVAQSGGGSAGGAGRNSHPAAVSK